MHLMPPSSMRRSGLVCSSSIWNTLGLRHTHTHTHTLASSHWSDRRRQPYVDKHQHQQHHMAQASTPCTPEGQADRFHGLGLRKGDLAVGALLCNVLPRAHLPRPEPAHFRGACSHAACVKHQGRRHAGAHRRHGSCMHLKPLAAHSMPCPTSFLP